MRAQAAKRFLAGVGDDAYRFLGAHPLGAKAGGGYRFGVWAPAAREVWVKGDFNGWQGDVMVRDGAFFYADVAAAESGQRYKFEVFGADGVWRDKADPFAFATELRPGDASVLSPPSRHRWRDRGWRARREATYAADRYATAPIAIYELHAGSYARGEGGRFLNWRELAPQVVAHVGGLGFTHVELLPPMEHPYDPSWGYQVTGYFAPTARHGDADDFRAFVDALHAADLGVIVDWVPAHFPRDEHGLSRFDGTACYAYADPRMGEHPDWGTLVFDYARPEVRSFLRASLAYWLDAFHVDGVRVDAVASMLYRDYSRPPGGWVPNALGGNWNLEAISLLQDLNRMVDADFPGVLLIAEESTAFPQVTGAPLPPQAAATEGLGFAFKWNMGWMHDTLGYLARAPEHRAWHHNELTFPATYAHAERFVLPLSHDEVVHGKKSLLCKMGGRWQDGAAQLRLLLGWQWAFPGKKLVFMGVELAEDREWNVDEAQRWARAHEQPARGVARWIADLNAAYRALPALSAGDAVEGGVEWIEADDAERSVYAFCRVVPASAVALADGGASGAADPVLVVASFSDLRHDGYVVRVPIAGRWQVRLCSADPRYYADEGIDDGAAVGAADHQGDTRGARNALGSARRAAGGVDARRGPRPLHLDSVDVGGADALVLDLPPLAIWLLTPASAAEAT